MSCIYIKQDGTEYNSIKDLVDDFYKSNHQLRNSAIYSSDEIKESTINLIERASVSKSTFDSSKKIRINEFITKVNPTLFKRIAGEENRTRLVPEYIVDNRIIDYISKKISTENLDLSKVDVNSLKYTQEMFDKIKKDDRIANLNEDAVKYYLSDIQSTINTEEKSTKLGTTLVDVILVKLNDKLSNELYDTKIDKFLTNPDNKEIVGEEYNHQDWKNKFDEISKSVSTTVNKLGKTISNIHLQSDEKALGNIKDNLRLITVDDKGNANIIEIKISKNDYDNWDSAKKQSLFWELSLKRQLLSQYINIKNIGLHVIPIQIKELQNPKQIILGKLRNVTIENGKELNSINELANELVHSKVFVDHDPARMKQFQDKLNILLPNYEIKTVKKKANVDDLMKGIEARHKQEGQWSFFNGYEDIPGVPHGLLKVDIEGKSDKEISNEYRAQIEKYVAHVQGLTNITVSKLKKALEHSVNTGEEIVTSIYNKDRDMVSNHLLQNYMNDEWDVITNIPEADALAMIVLKNKKSGIVNLISITSNPLLQRSSISRYSNGEIEQMKSWLFIDQFKDELLGSNDKLGEIFVYNLEDGKIDPVNTDKSFDMFRDRAMQSDIGKNLKINKNAISGIEDIALRNLQMGFRTYSGSDKEKIESLGDLVDNVSLADMDRERLVEIEREFTNKFPEYRLKTLDPKINWGDPKEKLYALLQVAIVTKSNQTLNGDFFGLSNYALGFSDFKSLIGALYTKDQFEYDADSKRIQQLLTGGLAFTTPDAVASNDLRNINKIISNGISFYGKIGVDQATHLNGLTRKYYKDINYTKWSQGLWGETQSKYQNMWLHEGGKVSLKWMLKNPYSDADKDLMTPIEREHAKKMLFEMGKYMLDLPTALYNKVDVSSLDSIKRTDTSGKIVKAIEDESYFKMPLVMKEDISKWNIGEHYDSFSDFIKTFYSEKKHELTDMLDPQGSFKEGKNSVKAQKAGVHEMFDLYGRQNDEYKARMLAKNKAATYELNLDTIASRIAFSRIKKNIFDNRLPIISSYLWWMKLVGGQQNEDMSKVLEYAANQLNLAVYDEPLINDETKDVTIAAKVAKKLTTVAIVGLKPASIGVQMALGMMKNVSLAVTQIYGEDQFTLKDMLASYGKLVTIDNKFASEFNMITRINQRDRMANMDASAMSKNTQTDRRGVWRFLSRFMYVSEAIPQYQNRMALYLAKMIHDGCYDAHSLDKDGYLKYDPTKDKRFSYYLENRDKVKDSSGNYIIKKGDEKYNFQRNLYRLQMDYMNNESFGERKHLTEKDMLPEPYCLQERDSFKAFSDTIYGYFTKDSQAQWENQWYGIIWGQFMQFWPGKMRMWFGKDTDPNHPEDSNMGRMMQKTTLADNGKKQLWWKKEIFDKDDPTKRLGYEPTLENTGDPYLIFQGTPQECLFHSMVYTLKDIAKLDFKEAFVNNTARRNRTLYAAADGIMMFGILAMFKGIFDAYIADHGVDGLDGETIHYAAIMNKRAMNKANLWQTTLGAINTEPVFVSYSMKLGKDIQSTFNGSKTIRQALGNIGALEIIKDPTQK